MNYDDDGEDEEFIHAPLTEQEKWLFAYLAQIMSEQEHFNFDNLDLQRAEYNQEVLTHLQGIDDLVQGDAHPWALENIMAAYHKHGG